MKKSKWEKELEKIGFDFREEQYVGAQDIADTFAANSSPDDRLMLEAPTGSGKTLMYLGVADIEKYPLLISTSGKLLQQQIAESWRCMTGEEAAIIKGRSNYICRNMAEVFRKRLPGTHPHFKSLQMLLDHLKEHPERDISLVASALKWTREFDAFIRNHLLSDSALCLAGRCGEIAESRDLCAYNALLQDASGKQIVITNHHALITITGNNPSGTEKVFSGRKLVVDEAHDLPEATTSVMTKRIGSKTLRRLMNDLGELFEETTADNAYALNIGYMVQGVARLLDTMEGISCADDGYRVFSSLKDVQGIFGGTCSFLEDTRKKIQVADIGRNSKLSDVKLQNLIHRYDAICTELNSFIHPKIDTSEPDSPAAKLAFYFSFFSLSHGVDSSLWAFYLQNDPETKSRELKRTFLKPHVYLLQLWDFFKNVAIVSATLTLPGKPEDEEFNWMAKQLGLNLSDGRCTYHKLASPFDLRKQCDVFIAAPGSVFFKPGDATPEPYLKACIHMTGKLIRALQGRTLSLYTASQRLQSADWTLQRVFEELPVCKLLAQHGTADKDELAREFIENHNAALLGTKSFFQGFDAPGETLSCLILEKLPFGQRGDPVRQARCRMAGDKKFEEVILPEMLMTLRQAFGRLIRSTHDRGIFILSDPRCIEASYKDAVLNALALEGGASYHRFSRVEEVLTHKRLKNLPFLLDDASDLDAVFEKHWVEFRKTALFRRITGINTLEDILEKFGIKQLHPWQEETIDDILNDHVKELLVIYPAGSGKSLTYQIPALLRDQGLTLVVSPLVSLMFDQLEALCDKGFERQCAMLSGGMNEEQKNEVKKCAVNGSLRLLYVTPERLAGGFLSFLKEKVPGGVRLMVIDEAHMIYEAGPNFRPLYYELSHVRELLGSPQLMLVTATAGKAVIGEISQRFSLDPQQVKRESVVRRGVRLKVNRISCANQHYSCAVDFVKRAERRPVLIYGLTKRYVHSLQTELRKKFPDLDIRVYDADLTIEKRNENHLDFLHNKAQVMIATKAYGMGIDKPDIWGVLFNNLPSSVEEFVQGFGRICRKTELLEMYCGQGVHQAVLAEVTFHPKDFDETKRWFIDRPFEKTLDFNREMVDSFCRAGNNEFEVAMRDESDEFKDAWIGLSFLKNNGYIGDFRFDWDNNSFKLDGIKFDLRNRNTVIQEFEREQEQLKQRKINALDAMQYFCSSNKFCRNQFLQIYFDETEQPENCHLCDNCLEQDMDKHHIYIRNVQAEMASLRKILYRQGIFVGSEKEFQKEFDRILFFDDEKFSAHLGNLERNHNESGLSASDYLLMRSLLGLHRKYSGKTKWQWDEIPELLAEWEQLQTIAGKFPTLDGCERARQRIVEWGKRLDAFPMKLDDDLERLKTFFRKVADYPKSPYQPFSSSGTREDFASVWKLHSDAEYFDKKFGSHWKLKNFMTLFGVTPEKPPAAKDIDQLPLQKLHPDQGWVEWSNTLLATWQLRTQSDSFQSKPEKSLKRIADCFTLFDKLPKRIAAAVQKGIALDGELPEDIILFLTGDDAMRQLLHEILNSPENISTELPQLRKCPVVRGYLMQQKISARNAFMQKTVTVIKDKTLTAAALTRICGKSLNYEDFYGFWPRGTEIPDLKSVINFATLNRSLKAGADNAVTRLLEEWLHDLYRRSESSWLLPLYQKCATQKILNEALHNIPIALELTQYYNNADDDALLSLKDLLAEEYPALLNLFAEEIEELAGSVPSFHMETEKNEIKVVNSLSDLDRLFDSASTDDSVTP